MNGRYLLNQKNTLCCVKMLTSWLETSDNVWTDAVINGSWSPACWLKIKMSNIEAALTSEYVPVDSNIGKSVTNPPEKSE